METENTTVASTHGMSCPKCGSDDSIRVPISVWADLLPQGSDADGDHEWDHDSPAYCAVCDYGANSYDKVTVADFTIDGKPTSPAPAPVDNLAAAVNLLEELAEYLKESHQQEIDEDHGGDEEDTCSYCQKIAEAEEFLAKLTK